MNGDDEETRTGRATGGRYGNTLRPAGIPFTRAGSLLPVTAFLDAIGASTERLLCQAKIPSVLLEDPDALIPLHFAYAFIDLAAQSEGIRDLGLVVGKQTSSFVLGTFGHRLRSALTVHDYLQTGIGLIGTVTSGERFWLFSEGDMVRFHQFLPGLAGNGRCHGDLYTLSITINTLRRFVDPDWSPAQVSLLAGDERLLGDQTAFGDISVSTGQPYSSFTIPRALLEQPLPQRRMPKPTADSAAQNPPVAMPEDFPGALEHLIMACLADGHPDIHLAAEAAGMSPRTLQRRLAEAGLKYSQVVSRTRVRLAAERLTETDMSIAEIATSLGYADASNFTRAFRRQTGTSPQAFRRNATEI